MENNSPLPREVLEHLDKVAQAKLVGAPLPKPTLDSLFPGERYSSAVKALKRDGFTTFEATNGTHLVATETDELGNVLALAAAIPRSPGKAEDYLNQVSDFSDSAGLDRKTRIALFWRVYKAEGLVNNACQKMAALVATKGSFKVRYVRGKRGVSTDSRTEEFTTLLQWWTEQINTRAEDAVVTGARGMQAFIAQGVRQALVEGDHIFRANWVKVKVPALGGKAYSLPMTLQSYSAQNIDLVEELVGTPFEVLYWVPPAKLIQTLKNPKDKLVKQYLDKLIPKDVQAALKKDGKYPLDPALMHHIKNRGTDTSPWGESVLECVMSEIAYKRSLFALELNTIEQLVNRLVILKIGSDNKDSIYHTHEVTVKRAAMLERALRKIGSASMLVWAGPDLESVEVSAHDGVMEIDDRFRLADKRIMNALGVPTALLTGENEGGKSAGWAAIAAMAAQLAELQNMYAQFLRTEAERIAAENGFEEVDVVWEFDSDLLANKEVAAELAMSAWDRGIYDSETVVRELGQSYEAIENGMARDVEKGYREQPFGPPLAAKTTNPGGLGGDSGGRPKQTDTAKPDPRKGKEKGSPEENK